MSTIESRRYRQAGDARRRRTRLARFASVSLALAAAISFEAAAVAATVRAVQGQVLVNSGQGYRLVDGSTQLDPGGTVVANPGAIAEVVYGGGCTVTVQPGSVYLIAAQPPCQRREPTRTASLPDKGEAKGPDNGGNSGGPNSGLMWALGGVAILGGGAAAYFLIPPMSP
jgi:hypothetical protein